MEQLDMRREAVFARIKSAKPSPSGRGALFAEVRAALPLIRKKLDEGLTVKDIAEAAGWNRHVLAQYLRKLEVTTATGSAGRVGPAGRKTTQHVETPRQTAREGRLAAGAGAPTPAVPSPSAGTLARPESGASRPVPQDGIFNFAVPPDRRPINQAEADKKVELIRERASGLEIAQEDLDRIAAAANLPIDHPEKEAGDPAVVLRKNVLAAVGGNEHSARAALSAVSKSFKRWKNGETV